MTKRTFTQHLEHLESMRGLTMGTRVRVVGSGRTGSVTAHHRHNGYLVQWDEPMFGVTQGWVRTANLEKETT